MTRSTPMLLAAMLVVLLAPSRVAAQAASPAQKPAAQPPAKVEAQKPAVPAQKPAAPAQKPAPAAQKPAAPKPAPAATQAPAPVAAPPKPAPAVATPPGTQEVYTYRAEGRRDPFVSLTNRGTDARSARKAEGIAGLSAADISLKGVLLSKGQYLAMVQGPDGKRQYIVHPNDRFADGVVKAITADSMLILQEVNDPLSLTKQREIRKTLRAVEEVK